MGIGEYHPLPQFAPIQPYSEVDYLPTSLPQKIFKHIRESTHKVETATCIEEEPREEPQPPNFICWGKSTVSPEVRWLHQVWSTAPCFQCEKNFWSHTSYHTVHPRLVAVHQWKIATIFEQQTWVWRSRSWQSHHKNHTQLRKNTRSRKEKKVERRGLTLKIYIHIHVHPNAWKLVHFAPSFICTDKESQLEEKRNFVLRLKFITHSGHTQYIHAQIHTHKH